MCHVSTILKPSQDTSSHTWEMQIKPSLLSRYSVVRPNSHEGLQQYSDCPAIKLKYLNYILIRDVVTESKTVSQSWNGLNSSSLTKGASPEYPGGTDPFFYSLNKTYGTPTLWSGTGAARCRSQSVWPLRSWRTDGYFDVSRHLNGVRPRGAEKVVPYGLRYVSFFSVLTLPNLWHFSLGRLTVSTHLR